MLLALARSLEITFVVLNSMADIYGDLPPPVSEHGARKAHADGGASNEDVGSAPAPVKNVPSIFVGSSRSSCRNRNSSGSQDSGAFVSSKKGIPLGKEKQLHCCVAISLRRG